MINSLKNNVYFRWIIGLLGCFLGLQAAIESVIYAYKEQMDPMVMGVIFLGILLARGGIGLICNKKRINILDTILGIIFIPIAVYLLWIGLELLIRDFKEHTGLGTAFGFGFTFGSFLPAFAAYRFLRRPKQ